MGGDEPGSSGEGGPRLVVCLLLVLIGLVLFLLAATLGALATIWVW